MEIIINSLFCFILLLFTIISEGGEIIEIPPIFYTQKHEYPYNKDGSGAIYYELDLCPNENNATQMEMSITIANNFDCDINHIVLGQVSTVAGNFTPEYVIGQNYNFTQTHFEATCNTIFSITKNINKLFFRFLGWNDPVEASIQLTYVNNKENTIYIYSMKPFSGYIINSNAIGMMVFWYTVQQQTIKYNDINYYKLNVCQQSYLKLNQIDIAVTSLITEPNSLFDQGGCPLTIPSTECKVNSQANGWFTSDILPISMYSYTTESGMDLSDGMWGWVNGLGGDVNQVNYYTFQAMCVYPPPVLAIHKERLRQYNIDV